MSDEPLVCAKCGSDDLVAEVVAHGNAKVTIADDGSGPYVEHHHGEDFHTFDYGPYRCNACNASAFSLKDAVRPKPAAGLDLEPGQRVVLPDGLRATVATVDGERNTFTVEGWHETFRAGDASALGPAGGAK